MGRRVSINDLPEELLVVVFDKVFSSREAFDERRVIVPLVCKRWAQLAVKPSPLWANCVYQPQPQPHASDEDAEQQEDEVAEAAEDSDGDQGQQNETAAADESAVGSSSAASASRPAQFRLPKGIMERLIDAEPQPLDVKELSEPLVYLRRKTSQDNARPRTAVTRTLARAPAPVARRRTRASLCTGWEAFCAWLQPHSPAISAFKLDLTAIPSFAVPGKEASKQAMWQKQNATSRQGMLRQPCSFT